jgi:PKD repeat protein
MYLFFRGLVRCIMHRGFPGRLLKKLTVFSIILSFCLISSAPVMAATTQVHIVRHAHDNSSILSDLIVTYPWMMTHLPVHGDGTTHYYAQGPVFADNPDPAIEQQLRWNPQENTNVLEQDMGAVKGTNLRDLCDLVGGMSPGEKVKITGSGESSKWFSYENVYGYSAREGPMVLTWYCAGLPPYGGPYPDNGYTDGMRIIWFSDTGVNPWGVHAFGNGDWHEAADPEYWFYHIEDGEKYPTTTGLSMTWVSEIHIYSHDPPFKPFPGCSNPPADIDGDPFYEDINGNGRIDFNDIIRYFKSMAWIEDQQITPYFDYNGNGRIDFNDLILLFKEI